MLNIVNNTCLKEMCSIYYFLNISQLVSKFVRCIYSCLRRMSRLRLSVLWCQTNKLIPLLQMNCCHFIQPHELFGGIETDHNRVIVTVLFVYLHSLQRYQRNQFGGSLQFRVQFRFWRCVAPLMDELLTQQCCSTAAVVSNING